MNKNAQEYLIEIARQQFNEALKNIKHETDWMAYCILEPIAKKPFVWIDADGEKLSLNIFDSNDVDFIDATMDDIVEANGFDVGIEDAAKRSAFLRKLADKIDESAKEWENS
jgi:hypothetical protein